MEWNYMRAKWISVNETMELQEKLIMLEIYE